MAELQAAEAKVYIELMNLRRLGQDQWLHGPFLPLAHELIYVWEVGIASRTNTFGPAKMAAIALMSWSLLGSCGGGGRYQW